MNRNTANVVRLLELATEDARRCEAQAVEIVVYDQDGAGYCYRWTPLEPPEAPPKAPTHKCEVVQ